jgi:hypothetical protein
MQVSIPQPELGFAGRHGRLAPISTRGAGIIGQLADMVLSPDYPHALRIRAAVAVLRTSKWRSPEGVTAAAKRAAPMAVAYLSTVATGDDASASPEDVLTAAEAALSILSDLKGTTSVTA